MKTLQEKADEISNRMAEHGRRLKVLQSEMTDLNK